MRTVRSLTSTAVTLVVLAAVLVVVAAFALPRVDVPGVDTSGLEQRAQGLVQQVTTTAGVVGERARSVVVGTVQGAVDGARDAAR